jgi:hypothetical protein
MPAAMSVRSEAAEDLLESRVGSTLEYTMRAKTAPKTIYIRVTSRYRRWKALSPAS